METFLTEDCSPIEKLNDDCLVEIFQCLSAVSDKTRIERVCKRWQRILTQYSWSNLKYFDILLKNTNVFQDHEKLNKIFKQHGEYLTTVSLDVKSFSKVCFLAPNLERLKLIDTCIIHSDLNWEICKINAYTRLSSPYRGFNSKETMPQCTISNWRNIFLWLLPLCENITMFHMELRHDHYSEKDFISLMSGMKKLKSFRLSGCEFFNSRGVFLLSQQFPFNIIEDISLEGEKLPFDNKILTLMISKCPKLRKVALVGFELENCEFLCGALILKAANLRSLTLQPTARSFGYSSMLMFTCIAHFKRLEKLCVHSSSFVNNRFLRIVGRHCKKLKQLYINNCESVTDKGIRSICNLEDLLYLQIRDLKNVKSPPLRRLKNLVALDCGWSEIEEECLCTFLQQAHRLRALFISHCDKISYKFLNEAVEVVKQQNSDRVLDINISYVEIDLARISSSIPSNLNIITKSANCGIEKFDIDDCPFEKC